MAERGKSGDDDSGLWKAVTKNVKPMKRTAPARAKPEAAKDATLAQPKKQRS